MFWGRAMQTLERCGDTLPLSILVLCGWAVQVYSVAGCYRDILQIFCGWARQGYTLCVGYSAVGALHGGLGEHRLLKISQPHCEDG